MDWSNEYINISENLLELQTKYAKARYTLEKIKEYLETYFDYNRVTGECTKKYSFDNTNAKVLIEVLDTFEKEINNE